MILSSVYFGKAARIEDVDLRDLGPSDHLPGLELMPKKSENRLLLPNLPYHWSWDKRAILASYQVSRTIKVKFSSLPSRGIASKNDKVLKEEK